jgi:hypothetical protein
MRETLLKTLEEVADPHIPLSSLSTPARFLLEAQRAEPSPL